MRTSKFTKLRVAVICLLLAATFGLVLQQSRGIERYAQEASNAQRPINKLLGDPDGGEEAEAAERSNARALVGNGGESLGGPLSAEEEKYLARAYPATEIPWALTQRAQADAAKVKARGKGLGPKTPGNWTLIGPSAATFPGVLNRTGAEYVTSGRQTAVAIAPTCTPSNCRVWIAAAGGGVWRTDKALAGNAGWQFVSGSFATNAIGSLALDPSDPTGQTIYAGTGEANASGDSAAGVGIYKSTNGGDTWTLLPGSPAATYARSVGSIAIDPRNPNVIYAATARGVRGVSSVSGGAVSVPPAGVAAPFGVYKSTDGGQTFTSVWDGNNSLRGVRRLALDPANPDIVYASAFQQGIWRSLNGGATWEQIFATTSPGVNTSRTEFAVTTANGRTRMYVADGGQGFLGPGTGTAAAQFFRGENIDTTPAATLVASGWKNLTSSDPTNPYYATYNYCTAQCWYDQFVYTPAGHPDIVYLGGSFLYGELLNISNGRGVLMSTDAGENFTDMTIDASSPTTPNIIHPDQHALVTHPNNPYIFFESSDGGLVRSSGEFADVSAQCDTRGLDANALVACKRLLSRVPTKITSLNRGLSTLQFQSLAVNPQNPQHVQGGTQDNGTWESTGATNVWPQIIYGDGGQGGFDSANPAIRFNTFFNQATDTNFRNGDPNYWVVTSGPLYNGGETALFYMPIIADPAVGGTMFTGLNSVWRTKKNGGDQAYLEANCPEFTTSAAQPDCGDWVKLGTTPLTAAALGTRAGGNVAAVERTKSDTSTLWAATTTGRVFISKNAAAEPASSVSFTRLDTLAPNDPPRFISSIYIDPADANRAWISYSGYSGTVAAPGAEPNQPGHVFEVRYNPATGTATWTSLDGATGGPLGDLPVTDLVRDDVTGDLYASTDFNVYRLPSGSSTWVLAGNGLPMVEVSGLTIVPGERILYAATHGRSAWRLILP